MNYWPKYMAAMLLTFFIFIFLLLSAVYAIDLPLDEHTVDNNFLGAYGAYVADMDRDGDIDILGAAWSADEFAWWENRDDGSNWVKHSVATAFDAARTVYAADVDGDGDQDFLGAAFYNGISWWENDGTLPDDGSPWTRHIVVVRANFEGAALVRAADVDQDGDIDVLGASTENTATAPADIAWWENTLGDGTTWTQHSVAEDFDQARSVYPADLDDDGDLDIVGANEGVGMITWWEALPSGGAISWNRHDIASVSGATGSSTADVNGDGYLDVLGTSRYGNYISWWQNDGTPSNGGWVKHDVVNNFEEAWTTYAFDMDQDGDLDILGASRGNIAEAGGTIVGSVRWWENVSGDGLTWTEHQITNNMPEARWIYPADFDHDGQLDMIATAFGVWQAGTGGHINWWQNSTIHRKASYPITNTISNALLGISNLYPIDLDEDGNLDVISASANDDTIRWYEHNGAASPSFTPHTISTAADGASAVYAADLDLDGHLDVISASANDDTIAWYENGGAGASPTFTETVISTAADGASAVYAADLDSDGDFDVISASANDDTIAWYENGGAGASPTFTETIISTAADGASAVYAADLDSDGDLDVISASANDDTIAWYKNGGAGASPTFTETVISPIADGASAVYAADLDSDGKLDVLSASAGDDKIAWYQNNGNATSFTGYTISTAADGAAALYASDLDHDGDIDVLSASQTDDKIAWYESDGARSPNRPSFTTHTISTSADGAKAIYGADLDSDGDIDILSASQNDNRLAWYPNQGGQFSLVTTNTAPDSISAGEVDDMLKITAINNGRQGDHNVELVTLELLLEEAPNDPLTTTEANLMIENLYITLDNGSGNFEKLMDTPVITVSTLSLTNEGILTVSFTPDDPYIQVSFNNPRTYFVVVKLTLTANEQLTKNLRITHITEASSTAQDADASANIPLSLTYTPNFSSSQIDIGDPLAVTLANFNATPVQKQVLITWETALERDNLGFNLYKGLTPYAPEKRLNEALIASQAPGSGQGASYEWQDHDIEPGMTTYYWLEEISTNGSTTLHGPISTTPNIPTAVTISEIKASGVDWWIGGLVVALSLVVTALAVQSLNGRAAREV